MMISSSVRRMCDDDERRKRKRVEAVLPTPPQGWLDCPRFGKEIIGMIIPSKVPLDESYNPSLPPSKTYNFKAHGNKLGLVIDLTNTDRYYNSSKELTQQGIDYLKIPCRGHDDVPDDVSVEKFVNEVTRFVKRNLSKTKCVLVHCTHGHNRTGFMIVHYLMRSRPSITVSQALKTFSDARPPGIYKPHYIDALYSFYHQTKPECLACPPTPHWKCSEPPPPLSCLATNQRKNMSNDDLLGDAIPSNQELFYQELCYEMLNIRRRGASISMQFPGSHPVSLDREGLQLLRQRYYYATWKSDGTRYMLLLTRDGCYLIDRKFKFRRVNLRFPCSDDHTLLDGEMVVDTFLDDGKRKCQVRRYLVYDLVAINGQSVAELPFRERWSILDREVIKPRNDEKKVSYKYYEGEPFGVRIKPFCLLPALEKKVFEELIPSLSHEVDGLIFQGWDDPYVFRTNHGLLKWKYAEKNSVDFLVEMGRDGRMMLFLHQHGKKKLMENYKVEFRGDDENPASYHGKLVECWWDAHNDVWVAMRVRVDKSTPNDIAIASNVIKSINDNITKEVLLQEIKDIIRLPMYVERIQIDTQAAQRRKPR